jgi:hypothetical protein
MHILLIVVFRLNLVFPIAGFDGRRQTKCGHGFEFIRETCHSLEFATLSSRSAIIYSRKKWVFVK